MQGKITLKHLQLRMFAHCTLDIADNTVKVLIQHFSEAGLLVRADHQGIPLAPKNQFGGRRS